MWIWLTIESVFSGRAAIGGGGTSRSSSSMSGGEALLGFIGGWLTFPKIFHPTRRDYRRLISQFERKWGKIKIKETQIIQYLPPWWRLPWQIGPKGYHTDLLHLSMRENKHFCKLKLWASDLKDKLTWVIRKKNYNEADSQLVLYNGVMYLVTWWSFVDES